MSSTSIQHNSALKDFPLWGAVLRIANTILPLHLSAHFDLSPGTFGTLGGPVTIEPLQSKKDSAMSGVMLLAQSVAPETIYSAVESLTTTRVGVSAQCCFEARFHNGQAGDSDAFVFEWFGRGDGFAIAITLEGNSRFKRDEEEGHVQVMIFFGPKESLDSFVERTVLTQQLRLVERAFEDVSRYDAQSRSNMLRTLIAKAQAELIKSADPAVLPVGCRLPQRNRLSNFVMSM